MKNLVGNILTEFFLNIFPLIIIFYVQRLGDPRVFLDFMLLGVVYSLARVFVEYGYNNEAIVRLSSGDNSVINDVFSVRATLIPIVLFISWLYIVCYKNIGWDVFLIYFLVIFTIPFLVDWVGKARKKSLVNAFFAGLSTVVACSLLYIFKPGLVGALYIRLLWFGIFSLGVYFFTDLDERFTYSFLSAVGIFKKAWIYSLSSFLMMGWQVFPIIQAEAYLDIDAAAVFTLLFKIFTIFWVLKYVVMVTMLPSLNVKYNSAGKLSSIKLALYFGVLFSFLVSLVSLIMYLNVDDLFLLLGVVNIAVRSDVVLYLMMCSVVSSLYVLLPSVFIIMGRRSLFLYSPIMFFLVYVGGGYVLYEFDAGVIWNLRLLLLTEVLVLFILLFQVCRILDEKA